MTPEQKRLLADALMDSAVQTADEAARLGLRDIPDGALSATCGLSDMSGHNRTQEVIRQIVQDRIQLRLDELSSPPENSAHVREYARRETELYRDLVSNIFSTDGLRPDPNKAQAALNNYYRDVSRNLAELGNISEGIDLSPSTTVEVPTFSEICLANKAGRAI